MKQLRTRSETTSTAREKASKVPVDVLTQIVIRRPPAEVAAFAGNWDSVRKWYVNIKVVEWETTPPLVVGSRAACVAQFLGRRMAYTYEVAELVPSERLVMRTADGPFPMETTYTWEATPEGWTRMTLRNRGLPTGFSSLLAPVMSLAMRRATNKDLAALKTLLEQDRATGSQRAPRRAGAPSQRSRHGRMYQGLGDLASQGILDGLTCGDGTGPDPVAGHPA